jgi:hypothetical protein
MRPCHTRQCWLVVKLSQHGTWPPYAPSTFLAISHAAQALHSVQCEDSRAWHWFRGPYVWLYDDSSAHIWSLWWEELLLPLYSNCWHHHIHTTKYYPNLFYPHCQVYHVYSNVEQRDANSAQVRPNLQGQWRSWSSGIYNPWISRLPATVRSIHRPFPRSSDDQVAILATLLQWSEGH